MEATLDSKIPSAIDWKEKGEMIPVFNKNIFTIDTNTDKKCLVILHGYPTSSYDFHKVLPELSKHYRVVLFDFIEFGLSDKLENKYFSVADQADYTLELLKILGISKFTLLSYDFGTFIAKEIITRINNELINLEIDELILSNESIPIKFNNFNEGEGIQKNELSKQLVSMLVSFGGYKKNIQKAFFDPSKITDTELKQMWYMLELDSGRELVNFVSNYASERKTSYKRWTDALKETTIPTRIIWGENDPFVSTDVAKSLAEDIMNSELFFMKNNGHFPMLESPEEWVELIISPKI